jgi:hypothetical protein
LLCCLALAACEEQNEFLRAHEALNRALLTSIWDVLTQPDRLEVLSLSHRRHPDDGPPERLLHGYRVLGRATIDEPAQRRQIVSAFYQSAREGDGEMLCFMPHHALHAVRGSAVVDIVICFHCLQYEVFDGQERPSAELSLLAQPLFQRVVREHHLPVERD